MSNSDDTLIKELWEARSSTPPNSRRASAYNDGGVEEVEEVVEPADEAMQLRISIVESRLLELVEKQLLDDPDSPDRPLTPPPKPLVVLPIHQPHAYPCADTYSSLPAPVQKWPQAPLMLRPTPGANMIVRGIRYASSTTYQNFPGTCAGCILPVNTGTEAPGKSLVVDFESPLFCGTLLMRVAGAPTVDTQSLDPTDVAHDNKTSYFDGKKRKFQVVIKGRFRKPDIPMGECVTGQVFDRAAGKLPARFIVNTFIKFISTLAPQLEVDLDGDSPRFLTPLVATAHTVLAREHQHQPVIAEDDNTTDNDKKKVNFSIYAGSETMEEEVEEPPSDDPSSVMSVVQGEQTAPQAAQPSITQRRNARKKGFNALTAAGTADPSCCFDMEKEYTFEFFQHLLLLTEPRDLNIDMGRFHVGLAQPLNGRK